MECSPEQYIINPFNNNKMPLMTLGPFTTKRRASSGAVRRPFVSVSDRMNLNRGTPDFVSRHKWTTFDTCLAICTGQCRSLHNSVRLFRCRVECVQLYLVMIYEGYSNQIPASARASPAVGFPWLIETQDWWNMQKAR